MKREKQDRLDEARALYVGELARSLERVVRVLSSLEGVERVSLFGSYARGRRDLFTDLDILVIMSTGEGFLERVRRLYGLLALPVDVDLLCYTPEEWRALQQRPLGRRILQEEVVLYEKRSP